MLRVNKYGKCAKNFNLFAICSNNVLSDRAGINKMLGRIANREDPDWTASSV